MKRRHIHTLQRENSQSSDENGEEENPTPPARKILKTLLKKEVCKALRELQDENFAQSKRKEYRAASLIPEFDPDSEECTVQAWIRKIEQIGEIHGWDDTTKSFYLQDKLQGQAKKWYNRLDDYNYTWDDWKEMLLRAFPKHRDYGSMLEEMLQRKKSPTETMTKYYQDKLAMCFRCKLSDNTSVSCIIRGLPLSLQPNARAFQCQTPGELYEGFLCALDDYRSSPLEPRFLKTTTNRPFEKKTVAANPETDPCPRCKKTGHFLRECTQVDTRTCFKCGIQGHIAPRCPMNPTATKTSISSSTVKEVNLVRSYNDIYKKVVKVNDIYVKAYLDTGSEVNVLNEQVSRALNLQVKPTSIVLKGFSGGLTTSQGEVEFQLEIDGIKMRCQAFLSNMQMNEVNLLIGQPVINSEGMTLTVSKGAAKLDLISHPISEIEMIEENCHFEVVTANEEQLPPGSSIIQVRVLGNKLDNNVVTPPRHYELRGVTYSLPATLLRGEEGYLKVVNMGNETIMWPQGEVLTRAESCEEPQPDIQVSRSCHCFAIAKKLPDTSVPNSNLSIGGVKINAIKVGPLNESEHSDLICLLTRYKHCFASGTHELGCAKLMQMKINLTTDQPVYRQPYRLSQSEQAIVNTKIKELLEGGIIKESESSYASPVILVKKKNGDSRLCVDYRALNAITVKDRYPLPNIDDQVSKLAGKKYFTSLDMAQGYHQVEIFPTDAHKTGFVTCQGHYEYVRVPYGLANAPSVFMRLINKIVESINKTGNTQNSEQCHVGQTEILAFLDDLLLPSVTVQSGLIMLHKVLKKFESENLKLNMSKCAFLKDQVTYLGHEISMQGIQPGKSKLSAVSEFPVPNNIHSVRQFIGLCSYFRKFIANFAIIARPLTNLTKKNAPWIWESEQNKSFEQLKKCLCSQPVLALYDPMLPTEIHTDACKSGIAGILLQKQTDHSLRPVFYFSRVTSREESMYHSYELETLAVVESLRRFRVYIVGKHVKVITDCTAVRATLTKRDIIPRIARWWLSIQDYDIHVEYRPGDRMKHVDALSRHPVDTMNINRLEVSDWFYTLQCQDDKLSLIVSQLKTKTASSELVNNYAIVDNKLYRKTLNGNRLVVPSAARWKIVQMHHDDIGHVGFHRCSDLIKSTYWFPKMTRFIRKYVTACLHCAYGKGSYGKKEGELHPIPKPSEPMCMVHIDHLGPFCRTSKGYQYILVMTDAFTKFVIAEPTRTVNSVESIRTLKKVFSLFGYPNRVVTDHGKAFTSRYFKQFATEKQFRHTLNAIACPRANGQVERTNRTILDALRAADPSEASNNWANTLPDVIWGINNTINESTGYKPYDLMFTRVGRSVCDVSIPGQLSESIESRRQKATGRLQKASDKMKRNFDKKRKAARIYKKGDFVLWRQAPTSTASKVNTKLDDLYSGPYVVTNELGNDRYRIKSIKGLRGYKNFTGLVPADSLRPYKSITPGSDSASSSDEQLETEDLIDLLES